MILLYGWSYSITTLQEICRRCRILCTIEPHITWIQARKIPTKIWRKTKTSGSHSETVYSVIMLWRVNKNLTDCIFYINDLILSTVKRTHTWVSLTLRNGQKARQPFLEKSSLRSAATDDANPPKPSYMSDMKWKPWKILHVLLTELTSLAKSNRDFYLPMCKISDVCYFARNR